MVAVDLVVLMGLGDKLSAVRSGVIEMPMSHATKLYKEPKIGRFVHLSPTHSLLATSRMSARPDPFAQALQCVGLPCSTPKYGIFMHFSPIHCLLRTSRMSARPDPFAQALQCVGLPCTMPKLGRFLQPFVTHGLCNTSRIFISPVVSAQALQCVGLPRTLPNDDCFPHLARHKRVIVKT